MFLKRTNGNCNNHEGGSQRKQISKVGSGSRDFSWNLHIIHGTIEKEGDGLLQMDFADTYIIRNDLKICREKLGSYSGLLQAKYFNGVASRKKYFLSSVRS